MLNDTIQCTLQIQLHIDDYFFAIGLVIIYYDYLLTLPMEVVRFWSLPDITWVSFFFYINRYLSVLGHLPLLFEVFWRTRNPTDRMDTCRHLQTYHQYLAVTIQVVVGTILIMRTFALYGRSLLVLITLVALACGVALFSGWAILSGKPNDNSGVIMPPFGCLRSVSASQGKRFALAWGGMLSFDVVVFLMTLYKSLSIGRAGDRTLLNVLVRDGAMYFAVIALATLANILTFIFDQPLVKGMLTTLTNALSTALISRLMLNLRDPRLLAKHAKRIEYMAQTHMGYRNPLMSTFVDVTSFGTLSVWLRRGSRKGDEEATIRDIELIPRN
jgi:hypothetical protein